AALLWRTPSGWGAWIAGRALPVALIAAAAAHAYVFAAALTGGLEPAAVAGALAAVALWFLLPLFQTPSSPSAPLRAALALTAVPALVLLALGLAQMRWIGVASGLWLAPAAVLARALARARPPFLRSAGWRAALGALALGVL